MKKIPPNPDDLKMESKEGIDLKPVHNEPQAMDRSEAVYVYGALRSDVGSVRERNEDSCFLFTSDSSAHSPIYPFALCLVADGMGGYEGGDRASKIASRTAAQSL